MLTDDDLRARFSAASGPDPETGPAWARVTAGVRRRRRRSRVAAALAVVVVIAVASLAVAGIRRSTGDARVTTTAPPSTLPGLDMSVSVHPNGDLVDGQLVTIELAGTPYPGISYLATCTTPAVDHRLDARTCSYAEPTVISPLPIMRVVTLTTGERVDCASAPGRCFFAVLEAGSSGPDFSKAATTPLAFAGSEATRAPASITVTPSPPYRAGQTIRVTGRGFPPSSSVWVAECPPATDCGDAAFGHGVGADAVGAFQTDVVVRRRFTVPAGSAVGSVTLECATGCTIIAHAQIPSPQVSAEAFPFTIGP